MNVLSASHLRARGGVECNNILLCLQTSLCVSAPVTLYSCTVLIKSLGNCSTVAVSTVFAPVSATHATRRGSNPFSTQPFDFEILLRFIYHLSDRLKIRELRAAGKLDPVNAMAECSAIVKRTGAREQLRSDPPRFSYGFR